MKRNALAATALVLAAGAAQAGGLDRSGTPIDIIFEDGNYAQLSYGYVSPDVTGSDLLGNSISNVADNFGVLGGGFKLDFGDHVSFAFIYDQPYGSDVLYGGSSATTLLGGTLATASSDGITTLLRYKMDNGFSIYGGPRLIQARGRIALGGLAYGPANGYNVNFASDQGVGFVTGISYEIPKIAFRTSLTYHSAIDLDFATTENFGGGGIASGKTNTNAPKSIKLAIQSGVAPNTLVFGSVRYVDWQQFTLIPPLLAANLAQLDSSYTYELGIGRRFTDRLSARASFTYDSKGSDSLVSPLAPTNGSRAITVGAKYKVNDTIDVSGGIRYTWLNDAKPETGTPDTQRGTFKHNNAVSVGLQLGVHF